VVDSGDLLTAREKRTYSYDSVAQALEQSLENPTPASTEFGDFWVVFLCVSGHTPG